MNNSEENNIRREMSRFITVSNYSPLEEPDPFVPLPDNLQSPRSPAEIERIKSLPGLIRSLAHDPRRLLSTLNVLPAIRPSELKNQSGSSVIQRIQSKVVDRLNELSPLWGAIAALRAMSTIDIAERDLMPTIKSLLGLTYHESRFDPQAKNIIRSKEDNIIKSATIGLMQHTAANWLTNAQRLFSHPRAATVFNNTVGSLYGRLVTRDKVLSTFPSRISAPSVTLPTPEQAAVIVGASLGIIKSIHNQFEFSEVHGWTPRTTPNSKSRMPLVVAKLAQLGESVSHSYDKGFQFLFTTMNAEGEGLKYPVTPIQRVIHYPNRPLDDIKVTNTLLQNPSVQKFLKSALSQGLSAPVGDPNELDVHYFTSNNALPPSHPLGDGSFRVDIPRASLVRPLFLLDDTATVILINKKNQGKYGLRVVFRWGDKVVTVGGLSFITDNPVGTILDAQSNLGLAHESVILRVTSPTFPQGGPLSLLGTNEIIKRSLDSQIYIEHD